MKRSILILVAMFLISATAWAQLPVTFQWDASTTPGGTGNPILYNMCYSAAAPVGTTLPADRICADAAAALEKLVQAPLGIKYYFATARFFALTVDGVVGTQVLESGPSNVLKIEIFAPPGRPDKIRIKSVSQVAGTTSGQTLAVPK